MVTIRPGGAQTARSGRDAAEALRSGSEEPMTTLLMVTLVGLAGAADPPSAPEITWRDYTLPNGMRVILARDPTAATVTTNLTFDVGSAQDPVDRGGLAHIFEHLVFQGSVHVPVHRFELADRMGASVNGSTGLDLTNYFFTAPPERLPQMLYLLSEGLGWLVPWLTEDVVRTELGVIQNERLQRYEAPPFGPVIPAIGEAGLAPGHPYARLGVGTEASIAGTTLADVKAFFSEWYQPARATLVVYGDFEPRGAKRMIRSYFAPIPSTEAAPLAPIAPPVASSSRSTITRPVSDPMVVFAWSYADDAQTRAAVGLLRHAVFAPEEGAPFHDALVRTGVCTDASFWAWERRGDNRMVFITTAQAGRTAEEVVAAINAVFDGLSVTEDDLRAAVAKQTTALAVSERDATQRSFLIQDNVRRGLPPSYDAITALDAVTLADLAAAVQLLRQPRHEVLVLPTPTESP